MNGWGQVVSSFTIKCQMVMVSLSHGWKRRILKKNSNQHVWGESIQLLCIILSVVLPWGLQTDDETAKKGLRKRVHRGLALEWEGSESNMKGQRLYSPPNDTGMNDCFVTPSLHSLALGCLMATYCKWTGALTLAPQRSPLLRDISHCNTALWHFQKRIAVFEDYTNRSCFFFFFF